MRSLVGGLAALAITAFAGTATAATITSFGAPASHPTLAGATVVDFSSTATGIYDDLTIGDVTFGGEGEFLVSSDFSGSYNSSGRYLQNNYGGTQTLTFDFAIAVSAFAFNFGAHDDTWTLKAYAGADLVDTLTFAPIQSSNAGQFYGIAGAGITRATLTAGSGDYILLDNFSYVADSGAGAVPEPATWALMIGGLGLAGAALRRRRVALA